MKKALFTTMFLLVLLASLVGTAAAAPMTVKFATLVKVAYTNKGPVFTFDVSDRFSNAELQGKLKVDGGGREYNVYCTQVNADTVTCNTSKDVMLVHVTLFWSGQVFTAYVPGPHPFCYDIYDWSIQEPVGDWVLYGTQCQETQAHYGDTMTWDNPVWGPDQFYVFLPESPESDSCPFYKSGDAYYYFQCLGGW